MKTYRLHVGSVQSKAISLFIFASLILTPLTTAHATDYPPSVPNSNVFTTSSEAPKVDGPTGAFTQRLPLDIPPGRNGLQPDVSLQYNSQNTSDGIVGYGWSLSIPYIERLNKTGSQDLYGNTPYFTSSIEGELAFEATTTPSSPTPSILDTLPLALSSTTNVIHGNAISDSFTYTVPSGGSNKTLVVWLFYGAGRDRTFTTSQNGSPITMNLLSGDPYSNQSDFYYGTLANPTSGTFSISWTGGATYYLAVVFTLQDADISNPIDATVWHNFSAATSDALNITTNTDNALLLGITDWGNDLNVLTNSGAGELAVSSSLNPSPPNDFPPAAILGYKSPGSAGTHTMTTSATISATGGHGMLAIRPVPSGASTTTVKLFDTYRARVDDGSYNSYSFASTTNTWIVYDKKGTKYIYGSDDTGRMYDTTTGTSTNTYRWYLQEVRDTNDNYIKYTYTKDSNVLYPDVITYTGHGSTDGISTVTFATSTRTDTRVSYASGFVATTSKVISEIDAAVNGTTVRKYLLGYGVGDNGYRSLLTSVQQKGYDDNGNLTTLPPTTFTYATSSAQFVTPGATRIANAAFVVADSNGNGTNDVNAFVTSPYDGTIHWNIYYDNTGNMTSLSNQPESWAHANNDIDGFYPSEHGVRMADVNGDGRADVAKGLEGTGAALYINTYSTTTGAYSWTASSTYTGSIPLFARAYGAVTTGVMGEFNGDGLPDFSQNVPGTGYQNTYLGNGSTWDVTTTTFAPRQDFSSSEAASQFIDMNGDGLDDWVYSDSTHIYVLLNTGTGWNASPSPQWTIATSTLYHSGSSYYDRGIRFMDLNGDGLPDFVRAYMVGTK